MGNGITGPRRKKLTSDCHVSICNQGCQMVYFLTQNRNLGKFGRVLQWNMLVYFMDIWCILRPFDIFYNNLVYFGIFHPFWLVVQKKSGNPVCK
jgi:hypothetical protein